MYRSEALAAQERAQAAVQEAKDALYWATLELADSECDHPDTDGPLCHSCGVFHLPEDALEEQDTYNVLTADVTDFRASGLPNLSRPLSYYAY